MDSHVIPARDGVGLHVGVSGSGRDMLMLSGGPGCIQYLEHDELVPDGMRAWFPEPRGVGRSGGGGHTMAQAIEDLETIRTSLGIDAWIVLGHSWGCDLAVRYAVDHPGSVTRVIGIAGHGPHKDRTWSQYYEEFKDTEPDLGIPWDRAVHQALGDSFVEWIHEPRLFRSLADSAVPMNFIAAGNDIRLPWPLEQLAALVPAATFEVVPDVPHDFWSKHPEAWLKVVTAALIEPGE